MSDKREQMTIMVKPSIKKRLFHWAIERGCKPCDVLEELVLDGLVDDAPVLPAEKLRSMEDLRKALGNDEMAIAKERVA